MFMFKGLCPDDMDRLAMSSMGWLRHAVCILANPTLEIAPTCGVVDCDAVTAVENRQAIVAIFGARVDDELHFLLYLS